MEWKTILKLYDFIGAYLTTINVANGILNEGDEVIFDGMTYIIKGKSVFLKSKEIEFRAYAISR